MWSVGVLTYLLITGKLPFDHEYSEKVIAKLIINEELDLKNDFKHVSEEALSFAEGKFYINL
jgi:hypothetical protein